MGAKTLFVVLGLAGVAVLAGCGGAGLTNGSQMSSLSDLGGQPGAKPANPTEGRSLASMTSWAIFTPPAKVKTASDVPADPADILMVHVADLTGEAPLTPKIVAALKKGPQPPQRILAYLNIGEADKEASYWQSAWVDAKTGVATPQAPAWLGDADPKAPGLYQVRFWDPKWQDIVDQTLDKCVESGFDGVCVQNIGAYLFWSKDQKTAITDMAAFVESLGKRARLRNPNFVVVTQGGEELPAGLTDTDKDKQKTYYFKAIDGILAENVFYPGDKDADNDLAPQADLIAALDSYQKANLPVLDLEYLRDADKIADFTARAKGRNYLPYTLTTRKTAAAPPTDKQIAAPEGAA